MAFDAMRDRLQDSFNRLTEFSWDIAHALREELGEPAWVDEVVAVIRPSVVSTT